ncbi:MAG: CerR family C-terminal domain-containing protein [Phycisphaerae bacterium]|nr:CerR family C-terminal domain-containing protein [Phycisphaerae bacterium]
MKKRQRKDAKETRRRLLAAAAEVFAEKGFWEATHAEICRKAKANTAAVNYHFGTKECLYVEAWRHSFEESIRAHPPDGGVPPNAPVEERLRGAVLAMMHRIVDPNHHEIEIMHKEMANPTGLLTEVLAQAVEPMRQRLRAIVREVLGRGVSDRQVSFCEMSLMGQCFGPMLHLRRSRMASETTGPPGPPVVFGVEELADHILRFSLAGMRRIRWERRERKGRGKGPRRQGRSSRQGSS